MSVIAELSLSPDDFELGRIIDLEGDSRIVLETLVPLGEQSVPFFRLQDGRTGLEDHVQSHHSVRDIHVVTTNGDETLYALDWEIAGDSFFDCILRTGGHVLNASGTATRWNFELRFPSHEALADFQESCAQAELSPDLERIFNPTKPDAGPWYGLTAAQREAITRAVESGYYSIPRRTSTADLATELGISDQAVTERLRRAVVTLVSNTILVSPEGEATADD